VARLAQKNALARYQFSLIDAGTGALLSGQAASITKALRVNGGAASEAVTVTEQGSSGYYDATFTPTLGSGTGVDYLLVLTPPETASGGPIEETFQVFDSITVTPAGGSYFTTLANVRELIGAGTTGHDALLANLIARCTAEIQGFLNRTGFQGTYTEYKDGDTDVFQPDEWPLVSITSVHDSPEGIYNSTTQIAAAELLTQLNGPNRIRPFIKRLYGIRYRCGLRSVKLVYVGGWATVPLDVEEVCIELAAMKHEARTALTKGSVTMGDGTTVTIREPHLTKAHKERLGPYVNEVAW
jgi:hypothetical protein